MAALTTKSMYLKNSVNALSSSTTRLAHQREQSLVKPQELVANIRQRANGATLHQSFCFGKALLLQSGRQGEGGGLNMRAGTFC